MKKLIVSLYLLHWFTAHSLATTWSDQIACIIYTHCSGCHNNGGIAPFPLMSYSDAQQFSSEIQQAVNNRFMPPWPPDPAYRSLAHERLLSPQEIALINDWVNSGAPAGNLANAPEPPVVSSNFQIPNPDLVLQLPVYTVPVNLTSDLYRAFVVQNFTNVPKYITNIEVVPGNKGIVHHVLVFSDSSGQAWTLDGQDPEPGYTSFGGVGISSARLVTGYVPGARAQAFPAGMGFYLPPNSQVIAQIHYPVSAAGQSDSTSIRIQWADPPMRALKIQPLLNHGPMLVNGPLFIAADSIKTFYSHLTIPNGQKFTTIGVGPHAHYICTSLKAFAIDNNNDTIPIIDIPKWDFHWQGGYLFRQPVIADGGTELWGIGVYDNTTANPRQPSNPPQDVSQGEATTDEMMLFYFTYTPYQTGDEDIVIDTNTITQYYNNCTLTSAVHEFAFNETWDVYPNPAGNVFFVEVSSPNCLIEVFNTRGEVVLQMNAKTTVNAVSTQQLAAGFYAVCVSDGDGNRGVKKLLLR